MKKRITIFIILVLAAFSGHSQDMNLRLPAAYNGLPFNDFADSLLTNYGIRMIHQYQVTENIMLRFPENENRLGEVLRFTLRERKLEWIKTDDRILVVPAGAGEMASLPPSYFERSFHETSTSIEVSAEEPEAETAGNGSVLFFEVGKPVPGSKTRMGVLSGVIREKESGEPVIGATVYSEDTRTGTVSNVSGNYFIKLPLGANRLTIRYIGKKDLQVQVNLYSDGNLNIEMEEKITELKAVVITSRKYHNIEGSQMGLNRIDARMINRIPVIGEADVLKVSLLLPGVQSVGEGTTGFNVRGGNTDQNLILLDKAPIFNPSHLMGFFSAINSDIVRDLELHKSVIPAKMGGRLSSVMEINLKNGNKTRFSGTGGVSPLTGRLLLEGPIIRDKLSFLISGRSTYSDWLLRRINNKNISNSRASFTDLNAKLDFEMNRNNTFSISAYTSSDFFRKGGDTTFSYFNHSLNLEWKHKFSPSYLVSNNLIFSNYNNSIKDNAVPANSYSTEYNIRYMEHRMDFTYFLNNRHLISYGFSNQLYLIKPGILKPEGERSLLIPKTIQNEQGLETAAYLSDEFKINENLLLTAGLRFSLYTYLGPNEVFKYTAGLPMDLSTISDTISYKKLSPISGSMGPEPRLILRYMVNPDLSVKAGYSRMRQYIHIMSNTFSVSPTDTWKLSDPNLSAQVADQVSVGAYRNFLGGLLETSAEIYYKSIRGLKDYKVAASLMMNEHVETEIIDCRGKAYGTEFLVRKPGGKFNGWMSYTYSRVLQKTNGVFREEIINGNDWFPALYDKPHSLNVVANYRFSRRFSVSTNVVYSSGRPITYPVARYRFRNGTYLHYSDRNRYRVDDYFRWDLSANLDGNLRINQFAHSYWSLSVYNLTGRDNVYSVYFISKNNETQGYKLSVFAEPIISLSYNFRF